MNIAGIYSFNNGKETVSSKYPKLLKEIERAIKKVDASICLTKHSKEKTMPGQILYSPTLLSGC